MSVSKTVRVQHGREYEQLLDQWIRPRAGDPADPIGELYQLLVMRGQHTVVERPKTSGDPMTDGAS